jgi:hypothetical protein
MTLKSLVIHRPTIAPALVWAAVATPKRGRRWIDYSTVAPTMAAARKNFLADIEPKEWSYWQGRGWSIERLQIAPLAKAAAQVGR